MRRGDSRPFMTQRKPKSRQNFRFLRNTKYSDRRRSSRHTPTRRTRARLNARTRTRHTSCSPPSSPSAPSPRSRSRLPRMRSPSISLRTTLIPWSAPARAPSSSSTLPGAWFRSRMLFDLDIRRASRRDGAREGTGRASDGRVWIWIAASSCFSRRECATRSVTFRRPVD